MSRLARSPPPARFWRTLLAPVWMRGHRWVLRDRADQLLVGVLSIVAIVVGTLALALVSGIWQVGLIMLPVLLYALLKTWTLVAFGIRRIVDFREGHISGIPFRKVRAVAVGTMLPRRRRPSSKTATCAARAGTAAT